MIKFENPSNGRFYYILVIKDMINDSVLRIIYGGRRVSRQRNISCGHQNLLRLEIEKISKKRLSRGYILVQ